MSETEKSCPVHSYPSCIKEYKDEGQAMKAPTREQMLALQRKLFDHLKDSQPQSELTLSWDEVVYIVGDSMGTEALKDIGITIE